MYSFLVVKRTQAQRKRDSLRQLLAKLSMYGGGKGFKSGRVHQIRFGAGRK